ncbi:MAG TPA: PAS domain S-box protein [Chitinophagaceae bacterium]|nr:PAS domain S-box protein [Chitinophagaceae bacterium]
MKKNDKAVILIVDDKPANILALENLLAGKDRLLLNATSGEEALKISLNKNVDLMILDVQMPGMDGFEVAQILKSNKRTNNIPIIFATAENKERKFMMKGYDEGAVDYLFKPLDPEVVKAKVTVLLKIQLQKKELVEKNASLQKSALLINNSADIIGIVDAVTFRIEEINNALTTILGYSPEEIKGTALSFFLGTEDRALLQNLSGQAKDRLSFETRIYCKDRSVKWLQWKVVVKDGKWFVNARDITEVKEVEKIRNYLATVVKQSNDAIYIHDHEGRIISWNEGAEKIYGYSEGEALKMKIWNIIPEYIENEMENVLSSILSGDKIEALETQRITKHGKLIDVQFSASVIMDYGIGLKSIAITERDITEQKIADEQIRQLNADLQANVLQLEITNKELESFSYSVSHDLRAPLRAMNGYSKILEDKYAHALDDEAKRLLGNIRGNAHKMGVLIDDLLAFSRLGRKEVQRSDINMEKIVETALMEIGKSTQHDAAIKINPLLNANADYSLLRQVWINLISNAVKYSGKKEQPEIVIGSTDSEAEITYYIKDNGSGFDMKYADKLFGVFQRLHNPDEFEGTGVGLAVVHRIITKHGGRIWADAKVNEGATFYFAIPKL